MKKATVYLGPPLSGKSTLALSSGAPRFSVRKWFEPQRQSLCLPPVGTMLDDDAVFAAVEIFLQYNNQAEEIALDGFPGNAAQLDWLVERLAPTYQLDFRYVPVDFETARRRSETRQVCFACDGGADPVIADGEGRCPVCGASLGRREDDTATRFFRRWDQYFLREQQLLHSRHGFLLPESMHRKRAATYPVDLHLHTTCSDGTYTPTEVIYRGADKGLGLCAITDHDSCAALAEADIAARSCGIRMIPGIEISTLWDGIELHLLGYGIDPSEPSLQEVCAHNLRAVQQYDQQVLQLCVQTGHISWDDAQAYDTFSYDRRMGGWKLLNYMIHLGVCTDGYAYFRLLKELRAPRREFVSVPTAVSAIQKSGVCILAHPGTYHWAQGDLEENLHRLCEAGIQGLECYHSLHSQQIAQTLVEYCRRHGLRETGGSDDHGNLPERNIGSPYISSGILYES